MIMRKENMSYTTLCEKWSRFFYMHRVFLSYTWDQRLNPFRTKAPKYWFLRGNKSLLYHQIGNRKFFIFITNQ